MILHQNLHTGNPFSLNLLRTFFESRRWQYASLLFKKWRCVKNNYALKYYRTLYICLYNVQNAYTNWTNFNMHFAEILRL